jgi:hypothetical protein
MNNTYYFVKPDSRGIGDGGCDSVGKVEEKLTYRAPSELISRGFSKYHQIPRNKLNAPRLSLYLKVKKLDIYLLSGFGGLLVKRRVFDKLKDSFGESFLEPLPVLLDHFNTNMKGFPTEDYIYLDMRLKTGLLQNDFDWGRSRFNIYTDSRYFYLDPSRSPPYERENVKFKDVNHMLEYVSEGKTGEKVWFPSNYILMNSQG